MKVKPSPTLHDPMDCSIPGFSVPGIFQARVLEWVVIVFSSGSSWPRDWTQISRIAGRCFTLWATREVQEQNRSCLDSWHGHSGYMWTKCQLESLDTNHCMNQVGHALKLMVHLVQPFLLLAASHTTHSSQEMEIRMPVLGSQCFLLYHVSLVERNEVRL